MIMTKKQMIKQAEQYLEAVNKLDIIKLERLELIAYGKVYGAAYGFSYLPFKDMPFMLNFIKIYFDDYLQKAYNSQLEAQTQSAEAVPTL